MPITMIKNETLKKYKCIWTKDIPKFRKFIYNESKIVQKGLYKTNFEIVTDPLEVKEILENNFSSKNRDIQYQEGLPSGTVLSSSLFPVDLVGEQFKISWMANISQESFLKQEATNYISLSKGTYLHRCLEKYIISDAPLAQRNLSEIIESVKYDQEIIDKIPDIMGNYVEFEVFANKLLPKFCSEVLIKYDTIGAEIFLNNGTLQGSVDYLAKRKGKYCLVDFKTTSKIYKQTGGRKFSSPKDMMDYHRQLTVYLNLLVELGYIPQHEKKNTEFTICQFHLISMEYKEFNISYADIIKWEEELKIVEKWYWDMKDYGETNV